MPRQPGTAVVLVALTLTLTGCIAPTSTLVEVATPAASNDWRPVDAGPREGAMGAVTLDAQGRIETYIVVEGDSADLIRLRFDIWWDSLADESGVALVKYPTLRVGDVLTFVPPTVSQ